MTHSRKEILEINPAFTDFILSMQASYKPLPFKEGDRVSGADFALEGDQNKSVILTKELASVLNDEQNNRFEKTRDPNPFPDFKTLNFIESRLVISSKKTTVEYLNDLAHSLEKIRIGLNESGLMILGDQNTPWLYQENDYLPVSNALEFLRREITTDFCGGFKLRETEIIEFIPHLFWLVRCNASLPNFYMSFPKSSTVISICKYGVMHFDFYDQGEKLLILTLLSGLQFREIDRCGDPVDFDNFDGRAILIDS